MAVTTTWDVEHVCGHEQVHDLSAKRVSEQAGYARWLAGRDCTDCWSSRRDKESGKERDAWLAERRAEELSDVGMWETRSGMPSLDGSEKVVEWGRKVRHQLLAAASDELESSDDGGFSDRIEAPARTVMSASWWIDQRDTDGPDLAELLADASAGDVAHVNENPF